MIAVQPQGVTPVNTVLYRAYQGMVEEKMLSFNIEWQGLPSNSILEWTPQWTGNYLIEVEGIGFQETVTVEAGKKITFSLQEGL